MTVGKQTFINRIAGSLGHSQVPRMPTSLELPSDVHHSYMQGASVVDLRKTFAANALALGIHVFECRREGMNETLKEAIAELNAKGPVLLADDPLLGREKTTAALGKHFGNVDCWDVTLSREENIQMAEKAAVGVAVATLALAETASVMLFSHEGCGRAVTLLPTTTVIIVAEEIIRPRLTQAMECIRKHLKEGLPASINFISGPSATADIELVRVQGVHGPVEIGYVIVHSENSDGG